LSNCQSHSDHIEQQTRNDEQKDEEDFQMMSIERK
jgi:hypothetical protein